MKANRVRIRIPPRRESVILRISAHPNGSIAGEVGRPGHRQPLVVGGDQFALPVRFDPELCLASFEIPVISMHWQARA